MLAALAHPGHRVIYAPGDLLGCRRDAARMIQGINSLLKPARIPSRSPDLNQYTSSPGRTAHLCAPSG
ncbi:hypothetical protein CPZ29_25060 [Klebsiella oxytoca]|nr:hypothetical protein CIG58_28140 [Klebsiella oxytoca]PDO71329.1 hypothetical protein CPZ29_25060 [Klebsiella oxytoca]